MPEFNLICYRSDNYDIFLLTLLSVNFLNTSFLQIIAIFIYIFRLITCCVSILGIKFHAAHNLNFLISDCHTLQLGKQKKVNSVIVENNPLKEQKNLRKAWFKRYSWYLLLD